VTESDVPTEETPAPLETPDDEKRRLRRRRLLYLRAFVLVGSIVVLVALVLANTGQVKISWVFGSSSASLVWIILISAALGWLAGLTTSVIFRRRTRRPRSP
jgi:uncharacterized integral membrane protein